MTPVPEHPTRAKDIDEESFFVTDTVYDMVVLGAGSGGYAAVLRGAQLGLRVALIEADKIGSTCLHIETSWCRARPRKPWRACNAPPAGTGCPVGNPSDSPICSGCWTPMHRSRNKSW